MDTKMKLFLIVYDSRKLLLEACHEFDASQEQEMADLRSKLHLEDLERGYMRNIVSLIAESRAMIEITHANYFSLTDALKSAT